MARDNNLTEGPIFKKFIRFVVPVILTGFLQQFYNAADTMVVGRFAGDVALAAVGSTSTLSGLIITLFMGLSVGTNVVCAHLFGAGNREGLEKTLHTSLLLGIILGIPLTIVGWVGAKTFLGLTGTPHDVIDQAVIYMRLYFLGVPMNLVYNFGAAVLRASGDTKRPLYILTVSGIVNVLLNVLCVVGFGMGVEGVAIGTVASQLVSAVWVVVIFAGRNSEVRLSLRNFRIYGREFRRILAIGLPSGLNGILFSLSNVFLQSAVNSFGKDTVAAHSVAWNFMAFSNLLVVASEQGAVSFVGQNMGARKYDRIGPIVSVSMWFSIVTTFLFTTVIVAFGRPLLGLFTRDSAVVEIGMVQLYYAISVYLLFVPCSVMGGVLRGMGKSILPTAINVIGICVLRVVWVTFVWPLYPTLEMIYYSFPMTWIASGTAMIIAYLIVWKKEIKERL